MLIISIIKWKIMSYWALFYHHSQRKAAGAPNKSWFTELLLRLCGTMCIYLPFSMTESHVKCVRSDFVHCITIVCLCNIALPFNFHAGNLKNPWIGERNENRIVCNTVVCCKAKKTHYRPREVKKKQKDEGVRWKEGWVVSCGYMILRSLHILIPS